MTTTNSPSRRRFLKAAGLTIAGATLTCAGLGVAATRPPAVELPDRTLEGEQAVNNRILVTYATRAGSTAEIATAIAETLAAPWASGHPHSPFSPCGRRGLGR